MPIEDYFKRYSDNGFTFSDEILSRYALSLAVKPFVILSGISGTGKTKIAQLFEPDKPVTHNPTQSSSSQQTGDIILKINQGMITGDRGNLPFNQLTNVFEQNEVVDLNTKISEILKQRPESTENISEPVVMTIRAADNSEVKIGIYLQRAQNPLVRVRVKSSRGSTEEFDSTEYFQQNYSIGDVVRLKKIGVHQFEIVSINDTQVITQSNAAEEARLSSIDNKCFISVKSNWTDASELFGYYNPITETYTTTKLLKFLLLAIENPEIPFFLILDEMNLSKVEHYFSDFLSCIESRTILADNTVKQEKIHLHSGSQFIATDDDEHDEIMSSIPVPLNLYVTGTVNIDDTTYMFSPKVLDRANVIELNDVFLDEAPDQSNFKLSSFPDFYKYEKSNMSMFKELRASTKENISKILGVLKEYNLHFGYRTISEVSHFIILSKSSVEDSEEIELAALDIQICQKILPKLNGNFSKLHDPIRALIFVLSESEGDVESFTIQEIKDLTLTGMTFERSLTKLRKMYITLSTQGFASFVE